MTSSVLNAKCSLSFDVCKAWWCPLYIGKELKRFMRLFCSMWSFKCFSRSNDLLQSWFSLRWNLILVSKIYGWIVTFFFKLIMLLYILPLSYFIFSFLILLLLLKFNLISVFFIFHFLCTPKASATV